MPGLFEIAMLIFYLLLFVGVGIAVVLAVGALRRMAESQEKSVALLEKLLRERSRNSDVDPR